jgi:hypothetical protein
MSVKLPIKPRGSAFLRPHAQEIGSGIAQAIIFSVSIFTYAAFEWPGPTHGRIIFHRAVKKQDPRWCRAPVVGSGSRIEALAPVAGELENCSQ